MFWREAFVLSQSGPQWTKTWAVKMSREKPVPTLSSILGKCSWIVSLDITPPRVPRSFFRTAFPTSCLNASAVRLFVKSGRFLFLDPVLFLLIFSFSLQFQRFFLPRKVNPLPYQSLFEGSLDYWGVLLMKVLYGPILSHHVWGGDFLLKNSFHFSFYLLGKFPTLTDYGDYSIKIPVR